MTDAPTTPSPERQPADAGGGPVWHRVDGNGATLLYTLRHKGFRRGMPVEVNDLEVRIQASAGSDSDPEPIIQRILAALSTPAPQAQPDARAVEARRNISAALERDQWCAGTTIDHRDARTAIRALSAPAADDGWRDPKTLPHPAVAGCFFAAIRVSEHGGPLKWQVHLIALDDETHDVHLNYDHGWRWKDYELWKPCVWPAAPTDEVGK